MDKVEKIVPGSIFPSRSEMEREKRLAKKIISFVNDKFGLEARLVGSIAKGTFIRGKKDMDIFVLFDKGIDKDTLRKEGLRIGKAVASLLKGKARIHYAEHPYTRIELKGRFIDIVPAYKISPGERIISAVDRTPLHTDYVISHLKNPEEVIKLKWFMKKIGVYGAEIRVRGFSGYLCELLVIKYGSFIRVLEEASVWEPPVVICLDDCDPNYLRKRFNWHLIVIDPVDPNRNVASPVSLESLARFVLAARMFLKTGKLPGKGRKVPERPLVISWSIKEENEEIIWSQLEAFANFLEKQLELNGFKVSDKMWWTDSKRKAEILLDLEVDELPDMKLVKGPSVFDFKNSERFIEKHKRVYISKDRLVSQKKREFKEAKRLVKSLLARSPKHLGKKTRIIKPETSYILKEYKKKMWVW